jgi:hypothetical protein
MTERQRFYQQAFFALLLVLPLSLGSSPLLFNDGDVSWHVAAGNWIIDHRAVPSTDPFSFTYAGKPWVAYEWLSEVIYAGAWRLAGHSGLAAVATLALAGLHLIVACEMRRWIAPWAVGASLVGLYVVLVPFTLARPHLLTWPLLALWLVILMRARERDEAPPIAAALLMVLWANLHPSWALGLVIAGVFGLEAALAERWKWRAIRGWLLFGLAALGAAAVNANGLAGLTHPLSVSSLKILPLIAEWRPSSPAVTPWFFGVLAAVIAAVGWRGVRLGPVRATLLVLLVGLALYQVRHQAPLAIVAALLLPPAFAAARDREQRTSLFVGKTERRLVLAAMLVVVGGVTTWRLATPIVPAENESNPRSLVAAVPPVVRAQPVINGYSFGGPLILAGIRPYIDGRADMYGDRFVADYKRITEGDPVAFARAVKRYDIGWTMTPNRYGKLVRLLDRSPGWRRVYADDVGVIHLRSDKPSGPF